MVTDREEEFKAAGLLKLCNGVPCGDTILRVVESVIPLSSEQVSIAAEAT